MQQHPTQPAVQQQPAGPERSDGQQLSIGYFRRLLSAETERLSARAGHWEQVAAAGGVPDEPLGELRSVAGQARLLIRERFAQFDNLVDGAEFLRGPRPTTLTDLQGFWEMIYYQVEDVDRKFGRLERLRAAGWRGVDSPSAAAGAGAAAPVRPVSRPAAGRRAAGKRAGPSAGLRAALLGTFGGTCTGPVVVSAAQSGRSFSWVGCSAGQRSYINLRPDEGIMT
ncbi:Disks large-associated protein 5 [Amphibalanus amphitrite]|uniref:Disks large-associated protein 5 n=1 Tax=Amphibalanus amphitrite TaxID=1232801 RepID=A0A6A4VBJ6_AMPAM|nr:Disks large-associated protein 5 [Amphibalanus amphitrite]